ncbi:MAG TPA: hypothetical protein VGX23_19405 [Actinocrinis sp.]|nr:hypothetical protein [Actinocrinis sp.]
MSPQQFEQYDDYQNYQHPSQPSYPPQSPQPEYSPGPQYSPSPEHLPEPQYVPSPQYLPDPLSPQNSQASQPTNGQPYQGRRARHARSAEIPWQIQPLADPRQTQIEQARPAALEYERGPQREFHREFRREPQQPHQPPQPQRDYRPEPGYQTDYQHDPQPEFHRDFPQLTPRDQPPFPRRGPISDPYPDPDRRSPYPDRSPYPSAPSFPARAPNPVRASSPNAFASGATAVRPAAPAAPRAPQPARADRDDPELDLRPIRRRNVTPSVRPPSSTQHRRHRGPLVVTGIIVIAGVVAIGLEAAGMYPPGLRNRAAASVSSTSAPAAPSPSTSAFGPVQASATPSSSPASPVYASLPGVGAHYAAQIPANTSQVVVAYGDGLTSSTATVKFFQKVPGGWQLEDTWAGHNGDGGWILNKTDNDLRSPIGVFSLTDAGGKLPNPGTQLTYAQSTAFQDMGTSFLGESLADAYNYVLAINYNHDPGTSPLSTHYPMGADKGTEIWLHVDHGGPTRACVSIPQDGMKTLLVNLNPTEHPVIVMGDKSDLAAS